MSYKYFSRNGQVLPYSQAVVPLGSVEYSYGYGVYETIRLAKGVIYFLGDHSQRLMNSARVIGLEHNFTPAGIEDSIKELVRQNEVDTCNIKVLLIGAASADEATLYIICLNPLFPDRKLYKAGVACITVAHERLYPQAKTLNMLPSYLAYKQARAQGAFDALLIDRENNVREGTRTNFLAIKGRDIISPPEAVILPGVMRSKLLAMAKDSGYTVTEKPLSLDDLGNYDGLVLTSSVSKIVPIASIDQQKFAVNSPALSKLISEFNNYLADIGRS